jgi:hypothetical protein
MPNPEPVSGIVYFEQLVPRSRIDDTCNDAIGFCDDCELPYGLLDAEDALELLPVIVPAVLPLVPVGLVLVGLVLVGFALLGSLEGFDPLFSSMPRTSTL